MINLLTFALIFSIGSPSPETVSAKVLAKSCEHLKKLIKKNELSAAAAELRTISQEVEKQAPLEIVDARILYKPAEGLGIYKPLPLGRVMGDELYIYAQLRQHNLRQKGNRWELHLVSDLIILDENGAELARDEGFGESRFSARAEHRDTFVNIAVRAVGLPDGDYRVRLVIHDRIGKKSAQVEMPFTRLARQP